MRIRVAISISLFLFLVSLLPSTAAAGVIRGTLRMSPNLSAIHVKSPGAGPVHAKQQGVTEAVIYLEKVPAQVERRLTSSGLWFFRKASRPRVVHVIQMNRRFTPRVLAIAAGTKVAFQNLDVVYHSAFSVSAAKRFDLGRYPPGDCDTLAFDRAGVINLHCDIHPDMLGYIVVTPNHAFTRPDPLGRYHLPKLPSGSYMVHVFHPQRGEIRRTTRVPPRGDVTLDLSF